MKRVSMLELLRGRLVVSCQAYPGEPMNRPEVMRAVALAVIAGGAAGVRVQGIDDIVAVRAVVDLPLIGLWKDGRDDVFITPTLDHALAVAEAGADIIALDGTGRPRPDRRTLAATITALHDRTGKLVMADCSTFDEGLAAAAAGADLIGTTLAGYTPYTTKTEGPDLDLVARLADATDKPVVAEGRIHTPPQAAAAIAAGAHTVVVGTAITHPTTITTWFTEAISAETTSR
jgi:N-acylglucosamine-6-phosphate 2-epimerase